MGRDNQEAQAVVQFLGDPDIAVVEKIERFKADFIDKGFRESNARKGKPEHSQKEKGQ